MILVIIIVIIAGARFFKLAYDYDKNQYLWGLIGISSIFIFQLLIGFIYGIVYARLNPYEPVAESTKQTLNIIGSLVSYLLTIILYFVLQFKWKKEAEKQESSSELLDVWRN